MNFSRDRTDSVALTASTVLPDSGAYQADPSLSAMVPVPANTYRATIYITYTRGGSGGKAAHKVFIANGIATGSKVAQVMAPDNSYDGWNGKASASAGAFSYSLSVELEGGERKIGIASAEVGATGTPGTYSSAITFG